jgi:hypothetical protein
MSHYIGREIIIPSEDIPGMWLWRETLFAFLQRNAERSAAFFGARRIRHGARNSEAGFWPCEIAAVRNRTRAAAKGCGDVHPHCLHCPCSRRVPRGLGAIMDDALGSGRQSEKMAANRMLRFAAGVVPGPNARDGTGDDEPDHFDQYVATIAAHIGQLSLPLSTLGSIASGLEQSSGAAWGRLADELRQDFPDLSDQHFWGVVLAAVDAIREVALTMPARNHVDSGARLRLFAMGLGVVPERRETIRALLLHDIDVLLGGQNPLGLSSSGHGDDAETSKSRPASVAAPQATASAAKCR